MFNLATKLPMIVKPKVYTNNSYGGYLLNDIKYKDGLFIPKKGYGLNSELSDKNKIYDMVNKMSSIPFKINKTLMEFILKENNHNLLIDSNIKHKFYNITKRSKYQESVYKSYNSKLVLQDTILSIA